MRPSEFLQEYTGLQLLHWDQTQWLLLSVDDSSALLLPEHGVPIQLARPVFLHLIDTAAITLAQTTLDTVIFSSPKVHRLLTHATPAERTTANHQLRLMLAYQDKQKALYAGTHVSKIRSWITHFHNADTIYGNGYVGLLPGYSTPAQRNRQMQQDARNILDTILVSLADGVTPKTAYLTYQRACQEQDISPLSATTFKRYLKRQVTPTPQDTAAQQQRWYWELTTSTAPHGTYPWEITYLDSAQLDLELISSLGQPLGRPWVTFLVDAFSRRILACYLSFDPPGYRSVMMTLRACVCRYGRLPHTIVADATQEFKSHAFTAFTSTYDCTWKMRTWRKPHTQTTIQRLFGMTNSAFSTIITSTKITNQHASHMFQSQNNTIYQLATLYDQLCFWCYHLYDQQTHPQLTRSPQDVWEQGSTTANTSRYQPITYDLMFQIATLPAPPKGNAHIHRTRGIRLHYLYYWNDLFHYSDVAQTHVEVRYDPLDVSVLYAFIHNHWVECVTTNYGTFHGHSEQEIHLACNEIRAHKQNTRQTSISAKRLATILLHIDEYETILLQRLRDVEHQFVIYHFERRTNLPVQTPSPITLPAQRTSKEV